MSKVKWTKEQEQVIHLRNRNILVSAAAGSGKTAVLVQRIITMITDEENPVDIDHLLIVTFTKAAASEMKERILKAVDERLLKEPDNKRLQKQIALIPTAQITTIDSFCQSIVRNYFNTIDIDPSFRVGKEGELDLLKVDVMSELLERYYEELPENFVELIECYVSGKSDHGLEDLIFKLYNFSVSYPWPEEWLLKNLEAFQVTTLQEMDKTNWMKQLLHYLELMLMDYCEKIKELIAICEEPDGPYMYLEVLQKEADMLSRIAKSDSYGEYYKEFYGLQFGRLSSKKDESVSAEKREVVKDGRDKIKKALQTLNTQFFFQSPEDMLEDIKKTRPSMEALIALTIDFTREYKKKKEDKGIIDFSDMEHFALDILVSKDKDTGEIVPSSVALELMEYYDEILIDEYQDSNYVQEMLLTSISKERMNEPNVFMVGDVKQSIYKFRMARPELFMQKYEDYTLEDSKYQKINLHKNFRSRREVLEPINFLFTQMMQNRLGGITYDEEASLYTGAEYENGERTSASTEVMLVGEFHKMTEEEVALLQRNMSNQEENQEDDSSSEAISSEDSPLTEYTTRELEAKAVARRIKELIDPKEGLLIRGKELDEYGQPILRPVRLSDIVILFRSMTGWAEVFVDVLLAEGINAYADTQSGYYSTLEIRTILNLLKVLDNPRQEIPLAAILHSPLFGLTSEELAIVRIDGKEKELYDNVVAYSVSGGDETVQNKLLTFLEFFEKYRKKLNHTTIYELIQNIVEDTNYYYFIQAMPAGDRRVANVEMLIRQAIEFEASSYSGLFDFNRYIEKLHKYEIDKGEASSDGEYSDAVRIMTIHKSKGLEFPVVFVSGMGKRWNNQDANSKVVLHADFGLGPEYIDAKLRVKSPTLMKRVIARSIILENEAEELRILYVALTRAKEKLILTGYQKGLEKKLIDLHVYEPQQKLLTYEKLTGAQSYLDWIQEALKAHPALYLATDKVLNATKQSPEQLNAQEQLRESNKEFMREVPFDISFVDVMGLVKQEVMETLARNLTREVLENFDVHQVHDGELRDLLEEKLTFSYPYEEDTKIAGKVTVSELKKLSQEPEEEDSISLVPLNLSDLKEEDFIPTIPSFRRKEETKEGILLAANEVGTLYHHILECIDFKEVTNEETLHTQLSSLVERGVLSKEELDILKPEKLLHFLLSPLGIRAAKAQERKELYREQQFVMGQSASSIHERYKSEEMILVQGIIDAFLIEEDGIVLWDYKTDHVGNGQQLVKRYKTQLFYYKEALEKQLHLKVKEIYIYSLHLNKAIPVLIS